MKCFDKTYNNIVKAELHCHLEGSIRTSTIIEIARENNIKLPYFEEEFLNTQVKVYKQLENLQLVLDAFEIAQHCFVSEKATERIAYELFEDANNQNIKLLEMRFSPDWAFSTNGLNWDKAFDSILKAKEKAEKEFGIGIGFIVISSRGMGIESSIKTIDWAIKNKDLVHGVDLADAESDFPAKLFVKQISKAKENGLKVTIHSGEDTPPSAVVDTINYLNPDRIGHGVHIIHDKEVIEFVKEKNVTLELCPWSNYLTNSVKTIEEHPLKKLFDLGIKTTINSDDPELLDTNLNNEYRIAHEILGMSFEEFNKCNKYALEASFLPENKKKELISKWFSHLL